MKKVLVVLSQLTQLKVSFIGFNKDAEIILGKSFAEYKLAEVSVALLTLGIRITLRV